MLFSEMQWCRTESIRAEFPAQCKSRVAPGRAFAEQATARVRLPDNEPMPDLAIASPSNFRDLAATVHPRVALRRRTLFRSDHLGALDADDVRQIEELGIRRVLDFRGVDERADAVCALQGVKVHSLPIEPTIVQVLGSLVAAGQKLDADGVISHMQDTYRGFVRGGTPRFAEFFAHLLESNEPTVFHCTAGKDRTGFAAALLLFAIGASEDDVMRDYLLTNERLKPPTRAWPGLDREALAVLWGVRPEFLRAALDAVDADYGDMDNYLRQGIGLGATERARLRTLYCS
jgi:protein-tyrosine phosphatase